MLYLSRTRYKYLCTHPALLQHSALIPPNVVPYVLNVVARSCKKTISWSSLSQNHSKSKPDRSGTFQLFIFIYFNQVKEFGRAMRLAYFMESRPKLRVLALTLFVCKEKGKHAKPK
jgi:hypothetical protein